jgi:hypothetical protein
VYAKPGNFKVEMTITTVTGCMDTVSKFVVVFPAPNASFTATSNNLVLNVKANDTTLTNYTWDFGDGGTGTGYKTSHTYTTSGSYIVTLIAKNSTGCQAIGIDTLELSNSGILNAAPGLSRLTVYPNPFQSSTTVLYSLKKPSNIKFSLYDVDGRLLKTEDRGYQASGDHSYELINDNQLMNGVYRLVITVNGVDINRQLMLLK